MGTYTDSNNNTVPIRWYLFAQKSSSGEMVAVTDKIANEGQPLPSGTYYFISEYAWGSMSYDSNGDMVYAGSTIQNYISDTTSSSGTFFQDYHIDATTDTIYTQITARDIADKEDDFDECNISGQKLWLLSYSELSLLNNNVDVPPNDLSSENYQRQYYKNIIAFSGNDTTNLASWWVRSIINDQAAYFVESDGIFYPYSPRGEFAVRPAFQLTIA